MTQCCAPLRRMRRWLAGQRDGHRCCPSLPLSKSDSHQGAVLLLDGSTGRVRALVDASAVTAIRTAAASAVATRVLSRADSTVLAIVGTGLQARKHLEALPIVRPFRRVLVAGRTPQ